MESTQGSDSNQAPAMIPIPPDFPVVWLQPEDAQLFWKRDQMHFPDQLKTMDAELLAAMSGPGAKRVAELYDMPATIRAAAFNTYAYVALTPRFRTPEELAGSEQRSLQAMRPMVENPQRLWDEEVLPAVKQELAYFAGFDLSGATDQELSAHLAETMRRLLLLGEHHFRIVFPMGQARTIFDDTYRQLFPDQGLFASIELLQGFDNISLRSDRAIWRLSRQVMNASSLRQVFDTSTSVEVIPRLEASSDGQAFLSDLRAYLDEFGHRPETWGLSRPSMLEDPTPVIDVIKGYLRQPDLDLEAMLVRAADDRERRLAEVREQLQRYPGAVRQEFELVLKAGQEANVLSEDHNYWIDFRLPSAYRLVILEVGRRLTAAGIFDSLDDAFHLRLSELLESLDSLETQPIDRHKLVEERKAELERFSTIQPPPALGTLPPRSPSDGSFARASGKFFGTPAASDRIDVLNGAPGSPGIARGSACVVRWLSEAGKLRPGDILVAPTTAPAWTPLFATAAGVVTDTGGILSHCAIVAREYGIPAVVGTGVASSVLRDGQVIEVDGSAGVVRIIAGD